MKLNIFVLYLIVNVIQIQFQIILTQSVKPLDAIKNEIIESQNYNQILKQIEEKRNLLMNYYKPQANSINNQNTDTYLESKVIISSNSKENNINSIPTNFSNKVNPITLPNNSNSNENNIVSSSQLVYENKINTLIENIQKLETENQKLKPLLKTIVDMQFYTFQKIKSYQTTIDQLNIKLSNDGSFKNSSKTNNKKNLRKNDTPATDEINNIKSIKDLRTDMDDDEIVSLIEKSSGKVKDDFLDP